MELTITNRSTACPLSEGGTHEVGGFLVTSKYSHSIGYEGGTHEVGGFLVTSKSDQPFIVDLFRCVLFSILFSRDWGDYSLGWSKPRPAFAHGAHKRGHQTSTGRLILDSSMVEHSAVNRRVAGSSPARGVVI